MPPANRMRYANLASFKFSRMILNLRRNNKVVNTVPFKSLFCTSFYYFLPCFIFCLMDKNHEFIANVRKSGYFQILPHPDIHEVGAKVL